MDLPLLTFAAMVLVIVATPGPTVLLALSNGSRYGVARSSYGIAGAALSDAVLMAAAGLGLGAVLAASALIFSLVKWVGVAYLVWLGVQMVRSSGVVGPVARETGCDTGAAFPIFRKSFLVAVTNPKGYLFFTAFLPQFIDLSAPLLTQYLVLALVFIAVDVGVMAAYAGLGGRAVRFLTNRGAMWVDRTCGVTLIALGGALAFVRRGAA
ncbi:LysE family translocator [Antarctobacter jejuensis]|uniref:LysE family translocator n=1 Tax=Antarctobacter jejuensis TaxID=1439938 RepID=UPI003FD347C6